MADDEKKKLEEEKKRKQAEIERKRAEVRARMEEASKAKKAKKGFMTPERKKKLRLLLRKKAAEELKKEQERKAAERRRIIEERCGKAKLIDEANEGTLKKICKEYYDRMYNCEELKWDLEREVRKRDWEISDLNSQVNDLRGKFVKPTLKKVSKYENKFAKLQKKAAEFNFRNQLKVVKKKEFTLEEEDKEKKPDWSKKGEEKKEDAAPEVSAQAEGEKISAEGEAVAETPQVEGGAAPAEGTTEGLKTEGEPSSENQLGEGQPLIEGEPPAEGQPPTEGQPTEEGQAPTEGQAQEEIPPAEPTGFEKFKMIVAEKDYDIIALPEAVIAPTDNKDEVNIPHYSLVEKRRNSGEGVLLYIKDSLRYKVVDFVSDNPDEHPSIDQLVAKLELNGLKSPEAEKIFEEIAAAEASAATEGAAATTEGATVTSESVAPTSEGAPPTSEGTEPTSEDGAKKSEEATEETKTSEPTGETATQEANASEASAAPEETPVVVDIAPVPTSPMVEAAA